MDEAWNMYGICMEYVWNMHGIGMEYALGVESTRVGRGEAAGIRSTQTKEKQKRVGSPNELSRKFCWACA